MKLRKAVVLCGEEGPRLRPFSFSVPGHMLLNAGHPARDWIPECSGVKLDSSDPTLEDVVKTARNRPRAEV
jgi:hypothetical protein